MKLRMNVLAAFMLLCVGMASALPKVVAHRGYWQAEGAAQNSIRALVKADSVGCHASEFDVWITADDVLVVNHDPTINGLDIETGKSKKLLKCRLKNGERLSTLDAYLEKAKGLKIDLVLELKPHKNTAREDLAIAKILEMVKAKGLESRMTYISFSRNAFDGFVAKSGRPTFFLTSVAPDVLKEIGGTGPDYHISTFRKHTEWVSMFKQMGMPINVWTVDSDGDLQWCIDHDVDFVTTNRPERAFELIKEAAAPEKLRVMSYNLRFGELADLDELAKQIKDLNPDFVALQEVDVNTDRSISPHINGRNMVSELAGLTGMFGYYARTINFGPGYYGIAILSKHPCVKMERFELPDPFNVEARVLMKGVFELHGKKEIVFAATHFDWKDASTRTLQAKTVLDRLRGESMPVILGGDFNDGPDAEAIRLIKAEMDDLTNTDITFPEDNMKLDYLFSMPKGKVELTNTFVPVSEKRKSDHLPVVSDIIVPFCHR